MGYDTQKKIYSVLLLCLNYKAINNNIISIWGTNKHQVYLNKKVPFINLSQLNITSNFKMTANSINKKKKPKPEPLTVKKHLKLTTLQRGKKGSSVDFHSLFKRGQQETHYSLKMRTSPKSTCCQDNLLIFSFWNSLTVGVKDFHIFWHLL